MSIVDYSHAGEFRLSRVSRGLCEYFHYYRRNGLYPLRASSAHGQVFPRITPLPYTSTGTSARKLESFVLTATVRLN
jgi:hypothetical protein